MCLCVCVCAFVCVRVCVCACVCVRMRVCVQCQTLYMTMCVQCQTVHTVKPCSLTICVHSQAVCCTKSCVQCCTAVQCAQSEAARWAGATVILTVVLPPRPPSLAPLDALPCPLPLGQYGHFCRPETSVFVCTSLFLNSLCLCVYRYLS